MNNSLNRGAVSIFIVIFTALLVSIVTTSFVQIMLRNQQQASTNDLSQSAYDSALAGVEDAKRALVALKACENKPTTDPDYGSCLNLRAALVSSGDKCDVLGNGSVGVSTFNADGESIVGDASLNQAYTCVTVEVETEAYEGTLNAGQSVVIPLDSVGDDNDITGVRISWFQSSNIPDEDAAGNPISKSPTYPAPGSLPVATAWAKNAPSLMRSQLIQFNQGQLDLNAFDAPGSKNAQTLFLFPATGGATALDFNSDTRRAPGTAPVTSSLENAKCSLTGFDLNGSYACSTLVSIPNIRVSGTDNKQAYLQLSSLYNAASYKVELCNGATCGGPALNFDNVQPIVDSTGRASDLFRRVRARVALSESGFPTAYPEAALYLGKSLCKDFFITDNIYQNGTDAVNCEASSL